MIWALRASVAVLAVTFVFLLGIATGVVHRRSHGERLGDVVSAFQDCQARLPEHPSVDQYNGCVRAGNNELLKLGYHAIWIEQTPLVGS